MGAGRRLEGPGLLRGGAVELQGHAWRDGGGFLVFQTHCKLLMHGAGFSASGEPKALISLPETGD
jgi:hypothetical protein